MGVPCSPDSIEFDPFSDTFFDDPSATYARLRDEAPVYLNEKYGFYVLSRHADVVAADGDPVRFVSSYGVTLELLLQKQPMNTNMMIVMDPPEHTQMRKLVSQAFSRNAIGSLEPLVAQIIATYLDALVERNEFDLVQHPPCRSRSKSSPPSLVCQKANVSRYGSGLTCSCTVRRVIPTRPTKAWRPRCAWRGTFWIWPAQSAADQTTF